MKRMLFFLGCCAVYAGSYLADGQGSFENLDFEGANVFGHAPGTALPIADALPGWTAALAASIETNQLFGIGYDGISIGGPGVGVVDGEPNAISTISGFVPLGGRYSAVLFAGGTIPRYCVSISETGLVPSGTRSLQLELSWWLQPIVVTLNGQAVNMVPLASFPTYSIYAGDIGAFAGQVVELTFTEPPSTGQFQPSWSVLDDIVFSQSSIPEPSDFVLLSGGLMILRRLRLTRRS